MEFDSLSCPICQVLVENSNWTTKIKKKIQFNTRIIPLPPQFIDYLNSDGIILPKITVDWNEINKCDPRYSLRESAAVTNDDDDELDFGDSQYSFPELEASLTSAIDDLGGKVFVKTNWSAPADAKWIMPGGSLSCASSGQIFLLLKASDLLNYDLHALEWIKQQLAGKTSTATIDTSSPSLHLVLKPFYSMHRSGEFRAFVYEFSLRGISQRHTSEFYPFLDKSKVSEIRDAIAACYNDHIRGVLPLESFIFDVYVDNNGKVWILDCGCFGGDSDPLLFEWSDFDTAYTENECCKYHLNENQDLNNVTVSYPVDVEIRIVEDETSIRPEKLAHHAYPDDLLDLVSSTGLSFDELVSNLENAEDSIM